MDIIKKWFLRIDIEREFDTPIIELYMQDVKTNLFITTLTNNGARIDLKDYNIVTLNILKADDAKMIVSGKVTEDGNVVFELDSQATSVKGICSATIRIYEGDSSVTSKPFYFSVIDDPYRGTNNSIISQNSYTALQNILSQTAKALEEAVKVNDYFKVNLPTVKELISYEPILRDIVRNKDEAKELIREAKNLQVKIDASMADLKRLEGLIPEVNRLVDKGNETISSLTNATESVSETIARADLKKSELEELLNKFKDIDKKAQEIKTMSDEVNSLLPKLDEAKKLKSGLESSIVSAKTNKESIDKSIESAEDINRDLGSKIDQSKTLSNNLKADIENAKNINSTLNSDREAARLMVTDLKNAKNDADVVSSQLNSAQIKANSTKNDLNKLVEDANKLKTEASNINKSLGEANTRAEENKSNLDKSNTKAESLKADLTSSTSLADGTNNKLKANTELANTSNRNLEINKSLADDSLLKLKELLQQSSNLESSLKEIIASGDLSKYVTDPKLQEVLKAYATKEDLATVDVTSQLQEYAKKSELDVKADKKDLPKKLSELENDKGFQTLDEVNSRIESAVNDVAESVNANVSVDLKKKIDKTAITDDFEKQSQDKVLSQKGAYDLYTGFTETYGELANNLNEQYQSKADRSEIPTKLSQLTNDENFKTEAEILTLINNSTKLKKEIVTSLPSAGKEDVIYLLKNKNDTNNFYTEYMWIGGKWEIIGDTKVDLSGYAKKSDIKTKLSEMTEDSTHRTLSDAEKAKVTNIPASPKYTDTVTTINGKTGAISKADIVALGIPSKNTIYSEVTTSVNGLMSAADKKRLDNIKEQVALTEAQYNALSTEQQNDSKKIYFIKA